MEGLLDPTIAVARSDAGGEVSRRQSAKVNCCQLRKVGDPIIRDMSRRVKEGPHHLLRGVFFGAVVAAIVPAGVDAQPSAQRLFDVTAEAGIDFVHTNGASPEKRLPETFGSGVAFLDVDGDGRQDLYFEHESATFTVPHKPPRRSAEMGSFASSRLPHFSRNSTSHANHHTSRTDMCLPRRRRSASRMR
jgi:hypothetical protein